MASLLVDCESVCWGVWSKGTFVARKLTAWLGGLALLLAVVALVGCAVSATVSPVKIAKHPGYTAGVTCDSTGCHNSYKHKEPYLGPCENCHSLDKWKPAVYSHKDTTFDNGMHPLIGCAMCHTEGQPLPSRECSACHDAPHAKSPTCTNCHTTTAWGMRKALPANHVSLLGGHSTLACFDCHDAKPAPAKARTCVDCHGSNHGGLTNCQDCHAPATGWKPKDGWSHDPFFKITGQHKALDCTQCHKNGRFAGTPKVCVGCHGKKHGGLTDCASCHTTAGFKPATFKHSSVFTLTGLHKQLPCTECHAKREFAKVLGNGSHRCVDCHGTQHGGQTNCAECHTTSGFSLAHHPSTFPLTGTHGGTNGPKCSDCHGAASQFVKPSTRCVACHAAASKHGATITQCQNCHTPVANWVPKATIVHPPASFPLSGTHATLACTRCHPDGKFASIDGASCVTCHAGDIPHVGPTDCGRCHRSTSWADVHFNHPLIMNSENTAPSQHFYLDFGPYAAGCLNCHPGTGPNPNFTAASCTDCH